MDRISNTDRFHHHFLASIRRVANSRVGHKLDLGRVHPHIRGLALATSQMDSICGRAGGNRNGASQPRTGIHCG